MNNRRDKAITYSAFLALFIIAAVISIPFVYMISGAFKNDLEVFKYPAKLFPKNPTFNNFIQLFERLNFFRLIYNSLFVSIITAFSSMFFNALVSYGFVRFQFKGKKILFFLLLTTMMIPPYTLIVPQFKLFNWFGWINTYYPLIIPFLMSAFGIFLIRSIMTDVPVAIFENASIDGCNEFRIFLQFALPLSRAGILISGVLVFMTIWNDFLTPIIYLTEESLFTLTIGLSTLVGFYDIEYGIPMAGALLSAIPVILILNIAGLKHFVSHMMAGSVKG